MAGCVYVGAAQVEGRHVMQEGTESLSTEMVEIIADLGVQFSNLKTAEEVGICDIEEQLKELHQKILIWDADKSPIWERIPSQASDFLRDVREIRELNEVLGLLHSSNKDEKHNELLNFAERILQMAMARLEDELGELLVQCNQPLEPGSMSFHSAEDESMDFSISSFDEESVEGPLQGNAAKESNNVVIDSIQNGLVTAIASIANLMFLSNYEKEFCQSYIMIRKGALEEYLSVLQIEKFSIDEVIKMEWNVLNSMIKKWNQAIHIFIQVCVARERCLCDLVFGELPKSIRESCFLDISKNSILQLLSIAMAIAISPPKPEKLFRILDTYEALNDVLVDMEHFFPENYGFSILNECREVLQRLKELVSKTIEEFKYKIQSHITSTPFAGGGVHHLTKYVMNYIKALSAFSETLDVILEGQHASGRSLMSEDGGRQTSLNQSPLATHLKTVALILEANLEHKSQLYNDGSLKNIFMMNNVWYMVDKVKNSDLRNFFGDEWIRAHIGKFQTHARSYERTSWSSVISFLKEEGISRPNGSSPSLSVLKDRFRGFNHAFEEVYKAQTAWIVPNDLLREDLRIAVSNHLIQAYRTFEGRYAGHLDGERHRERYIKYTADNLEEFLLDLFEGSPKSLPTQRRR
ncbi:exocyst complex component EXO70B1-like [Canna indica]|uniref:Exocyst subunit Exo70 family protein n=1 Tax=Canna indica TaxID=4628 RepID=A0AAQ3KFG9_9LILI|nr:exocyst complex component EXO70B1-like [Canna indica]